ncbi:hypothetical protein ATANTOWER_021319 [Ataeniobius toweri]|uniref:Uncharacterized protein n=1 Tax=Ataeniobius toweri TaxID=208326 RepID=A0ABU7BRF6_9TELE|nr:hypothetical protein [Ataeniobius toweri]
MIRQRGGMLLSDCRSNGFHAPCNAWRHLLLSTSKLDSSFILLPPELMRPEPQRAPPQDIYQNVRLVLEMCNPNPNPRIALLKVAAGWSSSVTFDSDLFFFGNSSSCGGYS